MNETLTIIDFHTHNHPDGWEIVNDAVMGGRSSGDFHGSDEGHGVFAGRVSLENNGGFSLVRFTLKPAIVPGNATEFILHIKGDGKRYQFRVKTNKNDRHSYVSYFNTGHEWQTVTIPFDHMYPAYRGKKLDKPFFPGDRIAEAGFLIGNKEEENFSLSISRIALT